MATREEIDQAAAGPVVVPGADARGSVTGAGFNPTGQETPGAPKSEGDQFTTDTGVAIPTGRGEPPPISGPEVEGGGMKIPESAPGVAVEPTKTPGMGQIPSDQTVSGSAPSSGSDTESGGGS